MRDSLKKLLYSILILFIIAYWTISFFIIRGTFQNTYTIPKDRQMVSYEYITDCRCVGTIEGYQSLVDDYNREECKSCGYHKE